jgi:hypothetical protein
MKYRKRAQNPKKSGASVPEVGSVDIAYGFVGAEKLLSELRSRGVKLSIDPSGGLAFNASKGVMTNRIMERIRAKLEDLVALLERLDERAAIMEHDGGMDRDSADRHAWADVVDRAFKHVDAPEEMPVGAICPWCKGRRLIDDPGGCRCWDCRRLAWVRIGESIVRADYEEFDFEN